MSTRIKIGDIVTRTGDYRPWRVVGAYPELGFARLECADESWVKSAVANLDQLEPFVFHLPGSLDMPSDVRRELNRDDTEIVSYWWGLWAPGRLDRVLESLS